MKLIEIFQKWTSLQPYKTRQNSVITRYGDRFEYASPQETPALMADLVGWYNEEEQKGNLSPYRAGCSFPLPLYP